MRKAFITICAVVLSLMFFGTAFCEVLTFQWNQDDKTNLKEWRLYWSETSGGPYDAEVVAVIPYDGSGSGTFTNTITAPPVTGTQGTTVTKYFVLVACGDIPQSDGTTKYLCSGNSNEASHGFWIPAGVFSVPVEFQIIPNP